MKHCSGVYPETTQTLCYKFPCEALCWQTDKEHSGTDFQNRLSQYYSLDFIHAVQLWPEIPKPEAPGSEVKLEPAIPISISCNSSLCLNCYILLLPEVWVIIGDARKKKNPCGYNLACPYFSTVGTPLQGAWLVFLGMKTLNVCFSVWCFVHADDSTCKMSARSFNLAGGERALRYPN